LSDFIDVNQDVKALKQPAKDLITHRMIGKAQTPQIELRNQPKVFLGASFSVPSSRIQDKKAPKEAKISLLTQVRTPDVRSVL